MKIYVGSAIWRTVEAAHLKSLVPLLRQPGVSYSPVVGDALIERSRSISATYFLRNTDADVHLSIDSDITDFTIEDTMQMCEQAMTHDIVGAIYVTRSVDRTFPTSHTNDEEEVQMAFDPTPVEARWVATGFLATHRRVFEKLAETLPLCHEEDDDRAFYPFYLPFVHERENGLGPILLSEDWAFCERAHEAGFKSYINPAIRLGHRGTYVYRVEDMFETPIQPHPVVLKRSGKHWRIRSMEPPAESRQARRARERKEEKVTAAG